MKKMFGSILVAIISYIGDNGVDEESQEINSRVRVGILLLLIVSCIISIFFSYYVIQMKGYYVGVPIAMFGIFCLYNVLQIRFFKITKSHVTIKSIVGRTVQIIALDQLKCYAEVSKENMGRGARKMRWFDLTVYHTQGEFTIVSMLYRNYYTLKKALTINISRNHEMEKDWKRKIDLKWGYGLVLVGSLLIIWLTAIYSKYSDLQQVMGLFIILMLICVVYGIFLIRKNIKLSPTKDRDKT